ncbi:MAG TPA: hypothetical protein ENK70_04325 [Methylophaga sp.]|nr:hypothetical protein [Methylophaga sp.]
MRVEFDNWESSLYGSAFILDIECLPRVGEELFIHKTLFPEHYFTGVFTDQPMQEEYDGLIKVEVSIVAHQIDAKGHLPRVCFDV